MATFTSSNAYLGTYNPGTNTFTPSILQTPFTLNGAEGTADSTFKPGEPVTVGPLPFLGAATVTYVAHTNDGNGWIGEFTPPGSPISLFVLFSNDAGLPAGVPIGTSATDLAICFLTGTMVATPAGERPVETLRIGDIVLTADNSTRTVRWIGRQSVVSAFAQPLRSYPIRIAAGALGNELPNRDLFLSPDHALLVDGVLVQAAALVNNTSITRVMHPGERFTYYHIETEDHALILAEGAPAETFVDNVTRRAFDNYAEYEALCGGEETTIPELELPRAKSQRQVPHATRVRLAAVAAALAGETEIAA